MDRVHLASRVKAIEQRMETWGARFDEIGAQISQLRDEMRTQFSAVRGEIRHGDEEVSLTLREEIRAGDEETRRALREEIRAGDEETRSLMRVLHEDVIERIATLGNAN